MSLIQAVRIITTFLIFAVSLVITIFFSPVLGIPLFFLLLGAFILQGLRRVDEANCLIVTLFGKRMVDREGRSTWLEEGWVHLPFDPWVFGGEEESVKDVSWELSPPPKINTPDNAMSEVHIMETFAPWPPYLANLKNAGGAEQVRLRLSSATEVALREFALKPNEEPRTWQKAREMLIQFSDEVTKAIGAKYPFESKPIMSAEEYFRLRAGKGDVVIPELGIILKEVNVKNIHPLGKLADKAELVAVEDVQRQSEMKNAQTVTAIMAMYQKEANLKPEDAKELVQTERETATKTIQEKKLNMAPELLAGIKEILRDVVLALKKS